MASNPLPLLHGRGTATNPQNRFEQIQFEHELDHVQHDEEYLDRLARPATQYFVDHSKSIIATNDSPDVGFTHSINAYRGCSHGCVYCYARPSHEFLGFSAGLDFETKVMVKRDAPQLLRRELLAEKYTPVRLAMSGVTDCYQPGEKRFRITRDCLEVLAEFCNPVSVITKNHLVTRDIDVLTKLAGFGGVAAMISITTLDPNLTRLMEPQTSSPKRRLDAIRTLAASGIPTGVMVAPIIPGLTDHEAPAILQAAAKAGATFTGYVPLRLPYAVSPIFQDWIATHFPDRAAKVLNRIRELRGGKLNDANFGSRMRGQGVWAEQIKSMFALAKRQAGITGSFPKLSLDSFRRPGGQMRMW